MKRDRSARLREASRSASLARWRDKLGREDVVLVDRPGRGYGADYAVNVTTHAALVGALMPTSHNMIIYALAAGGSVSIGALIAAGLLRLPIWALGFVFLARGAGVSFLIGEVAAASMMAKPAPVKKLA